nr:hypothetical protein [Ralstonia sp. LMG 6871]
MVRAILDGRKTQTRRALKVQPPADTFRMDTYHHPDGQHYFWAWKEAFNGCELHTGWEPICCPYGQPGDRLWVRENGWERPERTPKMMRDGADTWAPYYFDADGYSEQDKADFKAWGFKRRPSIHMPRGASRITLEITGVRVERLNDCSEEDARAEGVGPLRSDGRMQNGAPASDGYADLWERINGAGSWSANPWVWVVEFKRL